MLEAEKRAENKSQQEEKHYESMGYKKKKEGFEKSGKEGKKIQESQSKKPLSKIKNENENTP